MYKKVLLCILGAVILLCAAACDDTGSGAAKSGGSDAPVIESITQKSGAGRDIVDIYVKYDMFKYKIVDFILLIDGEVAEPTARYLNGKQFEFGMPLNLEAGKRLISVEIGGKRSNQVEYEILPPEITSLDLTNIYFTYYNDVDFVISGKNLGFTPDRVKVTLNGQELEIKSVSTTGIKVVVHKGISSGSLVVYINGKEMNTFQLTVVEP